jgi:hypothetical protein
MSTQVQYRRGTATQNNAFTGALAEITVDTTNLTLRVHDGINAGGSNLATVTYVNNQISSLSANSITDGNSNVKVYANSNVAVSVAGIANTAVFTSTGVNVPGAVSVTGNVTGGNLITGGLISATGNITGGNLLGNGRALTSLNASNLDTGTVAQARLANANVVLGSTTLALGTTTTTIAGLTSVTSTTFVGALTGAATTAGTVTTAAQPNITSVGTLTSVAVTGNTTSGNFIGTLNGSGANVSSINATNISSGTLNAARLSGTYTITVSGSATTAGTVTTAAQPNITSVGTLSALSVTGNITGGNLLGTIRTAAQTSITSVGTLSALSVTGNITGGNLITAGLVSLSSITKTGSNGVGNIGAAGSTFNTVFAKATSAQYADVAERYQADADYAPGTVLIIGGAQEVTASTHSHDTAVAGVISENPSYLMNSALDTVNSVAVALLGRVPCQVVGPIDRGDLLTTSAVPGTAGRLDPAKYLPGCVIGKALQNYHSEQPGTIEIAVGVK